MNAEQKNRRTLAWLLGGVACTMFFFGFALVPLYDIFCRLTGVNNLGRPDTVANTQVDRSRLVTIEFDANTNNLPWRFRPLQNSIKVHPGELAQAMFEVSNNLQHEVSGQAIASYGPSFVAQYFRKIECFCFTRQTLAASETRHMPVVFLVDGSLPRDVKTITLSYTFFEIDGNRRAANAPAESAGT